mgnify:CR=1 FL=1
MGRDIKEMNCVWCGRLKDGDHPRLCVKCAQFSHNQTIKTIETNPIPKSAAKFIGGLIVVITICAIVGWCLLWLVGIR